MDNKNVIEEQDASYLKSLYDDEMKEILKQIEKMEKREPVPKPKLTLQELRALRIAHFKP